MKRTKEYRLIIKVLAGVLVCALSLLPCMTTALADSVMNAGRAYGVYNSPNQSQTATSSTNSSGWSPKFGDFYDAFNEIKNLVTGGKQESGNNKPVGVDPTVSNAVESVTGRVGSGVNRMTGAVDNFDRLTDGNSRFDSETADLQAKAPRGWSEATYRMLRTESVQMPLTIIREMPDGQKLLTAGLEARDPLE